MLHVLICAATRESAELVCRVVQRAGHFHVDRVLSPLTAPSQFVSALSSVSPDLVLLDCACQQADFLSRQVQETSPETAVVGFGAAPLDSEMLWPNPELRLTFQIPEPISVEGLLDTARRAIEEHFPAPFQNLTAWLPAKSGTGASTTVLNVAGQLGRSFQKKVLLIEADLRSGVLSEALGVKPHRSTAEALACADELTGLVLSQHIVKSHEMSLMLSNRRRVATLPQWYSYLHLLAFVTGKYDQVMVDLPEVINDATSEVIRSARIVYVVVTPELPALELARTRLEEIARVVSDPERVRIVLNRWCRRDLKPAEVSDILQREVDVVLPNDYRSVRRALLANSLVPSELPLGAAYSDAAGRLIGVTSPTEENPMSRLFTALRRPNVGHNIA